MLPYLSLYKNNRLPALLRIACFLSIIQQLYIQPMAVYYLFLKFLVANKSLKIIVVGIVELSVNL